MRRVLAFALCRCRQATSSWGNSRSTHPTFSTWTSRLAFRGKNIGGSVLSPHSFKYMRTTCSCRSSSQSRTTLETRSLNLPTSRDQLRSREPGLRRIAEASNAREPTSRTIKKQAFLERHAVYKLWVVRDDQHLCRRLVVIYTVKYLCQPRLHFS